jgi:beta-N-acetylhexosaminidase
MRYIALIFFIFLNASEPSLDEKIGSLFIIPVCPKRGVEHLEKVKNVMKTFHISSVLMKQATPEEQIKAIEYLGDDIFVFQDAEWGLGMRMENTFSLPKNQYLKAIGPDLIYEVGREIARELKMCGCHVNLAPVADVNSNPKNIIIADRSFSDDPEVVAECAAAYAKGLMDEGILAVAKHFPGHGDVEIDSHNDLPMVFKNEIELFNLELIPFKHLVNEGIEAIMTAHLCFLNLKKHFIEILRDDLKFRGLVISDAMNMKGVKESPETAAFGYLKNGHDMLLYGSHLIEEVDEILDETIPNVYTYVKDFALKGEIDLNDSFERVSKVKSKWLTKKTNGSPVDSQAVEFHENIWKLINASNKIDFQ